MRVHAQSLPVIWRLNLQSPLGVALALSLAFAIIGLLLLLVFLPLAQTAERLEEEIQLADEQLARLGPTAASRIALTRQLADLEAHPADDAYFLSGESEAQVAVSLQKAVARMLDEAGLVATSIQTLPVRVSESWQEASLRIDLAATHRQTWVLLHALQTAVPPLIVDRLEITGPRSGRAAESVEEPRLTLRVTIVGLFPPVTQDPGQLE